MRLIDVKYIFLMLGISLMIFKVSCNSYDSQLDKKMALAFEGGTLLLGGEVNDSIPEIIQQHHSKLSSKPYIVIDRYCNRLFLRTADSVLLEASCSTGSEGGLVDTLTGRQWRFATPTGKFVVQTKLRNPWWRKPDWAYIEEGLPMPKKESERFDDQMMGDFAIGFGDGYFIHGTIYERLLGVAVTHGCVRLGSTDLKKLYENTRIGTLIYVF